MNLITAICILLVTVTDLTEGLPLPSDLQKKYEEWQEIINYDPKQHNSSDHEETHSLKQEQKGCKDCIEGDMKLSPSLEAYGVTQIFDPSFDRPQTIMHGAQRLRDYKWPDNTLVYELRKRLSKTSRDAAIRAMNLLKKYTCIKFRERTSTDRDYAFFQELDGCWAYVGRSGGGQPINYGRGCHTLGTTVHEIIHTLGFFHEQSRNDRDTYLDIKLENVEGKYHRNFKKYSLEEIDHLHVKYDYDSVMHYPDDAFTRGGRISIVPKLDGAKIGQRDGISNRDIEKVNTYYNCPLRNPQCVDRSKNCERWKKEGQCHKQAKYMFQYCPNACGACKFFEGCADKTHDCITRAKVRYACKNEDMRRDCKVSCHACPDDFVKEAVCVDKEVIKCPRWNQLGFCAKSSRYRNYMAKKCKMTCKICKPPKIPTRISDNQKCRDGESSCKEWKSLGYCFKNSTLHGYVTEVCRFSCGECSFTEIANDVQNKNYCELWSQNGFCSKDGVTKSYVAEMCSTSCGTCLKNNTSTGGNDQCQDKDENCGGWVKSGLCSNKNFQEYMKLKCSKSCENVEQHDIVELEECTNKHYNCPDWAEKGYCSHSSKFHANTLQYCPRACNRCPNHDAPSLDTASEQEQCIDQNVRSCPTWAKDGYCKTTKYGPTMKKMCPKSCQCCKVSCIDRKEQCATWAKDGYCKHEKYVEIMTQDCPKSCNFCESTETTTTKKPKPEPKITGPDPFEHYGLVLCDPSTPDQASCNLWKTLGRCGPGVYQPMTHAACPRTCGICHHHEIYRETTLSNDGRTEEADDKVDCSSVKAHESPLCKDWALEGKCSSMKTTMSEHCAKTCGYC